MMANPRQRIDTFVWTDDEVDLLLHVTLDYKASKYRENVDWESCQSKYSDIFEAFLEQYPSDESAGAKEFPHSKEALSKGQLTSKLKAIRGKYKQAVDSGRRRGHGRVILLYYELCKKIWGGSPEAHAIEAGIETADVQVDPDDSSASSIRCSTPASESSVALDPPSHEQTACRNLSAEVVKTRRDMLQAKLNSHRGDRLKRRLQADPAVLEDLQIKRRMVDLLEEAERRNTERLDKITENISNITNTIHEGFSLLKQMLSQPQPHVACSPGPPSGFTHAPRYQEDQSHCIAFHTGLHREVKQEDPEPPQIKENHEDAEIKCTFSSVTVKTEDEDEPQSFQLHHNWTEEGRDFIGGTD